MKKISPPSHLEHAVYYEKYLPLVNKDDSVLDQLRENFKTIHGVLKELSKEQLQYTYAEGKWTIPDILMHLIDCERVFLYRAMRFSRNDRTPLPFFDEDEYAKQAMASKIPIKKLLTEYASTRKATISFFNNLTAAQLKRVGMASNYNMSVRACVWIICAHEIHHWNVINERYQINPAK